MLGKNIQLAAAILCFTFSTLSCSLAHAIPLRVWYYGAVTNTTGGPVWDLHVGTTDTALQAHSNSFKTTTITAAAANAGYNSDINFTKPWNANGIANGATVEYGFRTWFFLSTGATINTYWTDQNGNMVQGGVSSTTANDTLTQNADGTMTLDIFMASAPIAYTSVQYWSGIPATFLEDQSLMLPDAILLSNGASITEQLGPGILDSLDPIEITFSPSPEGYYDGFRLITGTDEFGNPVGVGFAFAVPEPASLSLVGIGLSAMLLAAWRRKKV